MRTLLEKLKPEIAQAIEQDVELYPASVEYLKALLSDKISFLELTISDAYKLIQFTKDCKFGIVEIMNLFEPD